MHRSPSSPVLTDTAADAAAPVVHLTRRARIEAERATSTTTVKRPSVATKRPSVAVKRASDLTEHPRERAGQAEPSRASRPVTPPAPASPIDLAPTSPAMPASTASPVTPVTPLAPSSPVVASTARAVTAPARDRVEPATAPTESARQRAGAPAARRTTRPAGRRPVTHVDRATRHIARTAGPAPVTPVRSGSSFQRTASRITAVGALLFAAGLVVSTSLPAQALFTPETGSTAARQPTSGATQSLLVEAGASDGETTRDQYSVTSTTQYKHVDASSFTNDPTGTIQWPFLTGVPITSGFGGRQVEGCSFCSTNHMGVDFAPGEGTPIRTIAAGTVIKVQPNDGGFGNDVWVEHDVDGKQFTSVYGHMEDNSFKVVKGQHVEVGDELGLVGSTGNSTGPHLHLEVHVDGVPVDPLAWLRANAN